MGIPRRLIAGTVLSAGLLVTLQAQDKSNEPTPKVVFKGHTEAIYSTAFNKDGTLAATGSFDKSVRLWDPASGKQLREFSGPNGHQGLVLSVAFSPAGDQIASGGTDNTAKVWDVPLSTPVRELTHAAAVTAVAVSPDGKTVAATARDGSVKLWAADGKPIATLSGHPGGATGAAFSANGQVLASCGADGAARFWNSADGKPIATIGAHGSPITGVAFSPNNNQVYTVGEDGLWKSWQFPVPAPRQLPAHADAITSMVLSVDGNSTLTGGADKSVKLASVANGQLIRDFAGATAAITSVAQWPNGAAVAAGTTDGKVFLWTVDGKPAGTLNAHVGAVTGIAVNANGSGFVTVGADGALRSWAYPIIASKTIPHPDRVVGTALSADGKRLITAGADKIVRTWAFPAGTAERQFTGHGGAVSGAAITPDNTTVLSAGADETVRVWNAANGMQIASFAGHAGPIHTLAIAPNGQFAATGGEDGLIKVWALPATAPKQFAHPEAVTAFATSPDGNRVLTTSTDKQARIWNLSQPAAERTYALGQPVTAVAFAADNATIALATADKSLSIRNGDKEVKKLALPAEARSLTFAPNGATVIAGLADNSIRIFNVADSKESKNVTGHSGVVVDLMYAPKGDLLASAGADKTVRFWAAADAAAKGKLDLSFVPSGLSISKDQARLAVAGEKTIALFTLADNKPAGTITLPGEVRGVSLSPDGQRVAAACFDNRVRVYGPDLKLQEVFVHDGAAAGVAFHPDGKRIVSISADKSLRLWIPALVAQLAHAGPVRQLLISADSARILSVGDDKQLRIWDAKTAKEQKAIPAGDAAIVGLSLTADGTKVATGGADKTAKIWTVADGKAVVSIPLPGPSQAIAVSPNGSRLAIALTDGPVSKLRVYDAATGRELQSLPDATGPVRSLLFLADNRTLIAGGDDKAVTVHDVAVTAAFPVHTGGAVAVALHPSAPQALTGGVDKTLKLWDLATGKEPKTIATLPEPITSIAVTRDFAAVAVSAGKVARIYQVSDSKELGTITHPADVVAVNFSGADTTRLVTGATDNFARVWELQAGRLLQTFSHGGAVRGVAMHPSQPLIVTASADKTGTAYPLALTRAVPASAKPLHTVVATTDAARVIIGGDDSTVRVFNAASGAEERKFEGATGPIYAVAVSKNIQVLAAAGADKTVRVYTFADGKEVAKITAAAPVRGLVFSADARMLVGVADDKTVTVWNVAFQPGQPLPDDFGKVIQQFSHADAATAVAMTEKGELFAGSADKTVKQWKVAASAPTRNFQHPNLVDAVAWSPDGKFLATACHDGIVRTFDIEKNAPAKSINAHTTPQAAPVYSVTWTTDGKSLISTSFDKSMKMWDANTGMLVREFKPFAEKGNEKGHTDQVFCAAITKDAKFIATGSSDRKIKLWNAADGTVVREFANPNIRGEPGQSHPGGVYQLRFTPDEKYLVSVGPAPRNRGYVAVWTVADGKLVAGMDVSFGPVFGLALNPNGKNLLLGCGPRLRQVSEAEAVEISLPPAR